MSGIDDAGAIPVERDSPNSSFRARSPEVLRHIHLGLLRLAECQDVGVTSEEGADCFICSKHRLGDAAQGGVLYEDDLVYAGHVHALNGPSAYRGYLMVEPKRHASGLGDLTDDEAAAIGQISNRLARVLKESEGAEHVYAFVFGDAVPHLHLHLAPRYPGTPSEYRGARISQWPDAPRVDVDGMRAVVARLRERLDEA